MRFFLTVLSFIFIASCGGATEGTANITSAASASAETTSTETTKLASVEEKAGSSDDYNVIFGSCRNFETKKVCNCITKVIEEELTPASFAKIAEGVKNGAPTPMAAASGFQGADKKAFETAMAKWNANCELN